MKKRHKDILEILFEDEDRLKVFGYVSDMPASPFGAVHVAEQVDLSIVQATKILEDFCRWKLLYTTKEGEGRKQLYAINPSSEALHHLSEFAQELSLVYFDDVEAKTGKKDED